jgi:large subunit ribosomal protein L4
VALLKSLNPKRLDWTMPEIELHDLKNNKVGSVEASAGVFDVKIHKPLVQAVVNKQLAKRRGGNAATKQSRGELSGGGKKPWRQKGTGRARQGSIRSAQWRGGLTIFGPSPRSYDFKVSKKARQLALKSALTERFRNGNFVVVDKIDLETPKTKEAVQMLKDMSLSGKTLFLVTDDNVNLRLAIRNLAGINLLKVDGLNVYDLLLHEKLVCTQDALKKIEERLS